MKRFTFLLVVLGSFELLLAKEKSAFTYPPAPKSDQTDNFHGTEVSDPFRPLENADSEETRKWIEAENKLTFDYLATVPERKRINERLTALWNYEKYGVPFREGAVTFSRRTAACKIKAFFTPQ